MVLRVFGVSLSTPPLFWFVLFSLGLLFLFSLSYTFESQLKAFLVQESSGLFLLFFLLQGAAPLFLLCFLSVKMALVPFQVWLQEALQEVA